MLLAVRAALFDNFRQAVERIIQRVYAPKPVSSSSGTSESAQYVLTDNDADVLALVFAIEDCLFHGLKVRMRCVSCLAMHGLT